MPLGASERDGGINFSVFSRHASRVWLELFDHPQDDTPSTKIELSSPTNRTGDIWHVWVGGIGHNQIYAFRMSGPYIPREGHRFNRHKLLLDPYATAIVGTEHWDFERARGFDTRSLLRDLSYSMENNARYMAKCLVMGNEFPWDGDRLLKHPWSETIIYETHVRGLTIHPSAGVRYPGKFLGVIEKIPYFKQVGITAVGLMPIHEFNENEIDRLNPLTCEPLRNYWGYSTVSFFAPKESYSTGSSLGCQVTEFKTMVRELHRAGIEIMLDIVFNHTAEGNELGPTLNFRGMDNSIYYMLNEDKRCYKNYSGCGNTVKCNHPVVHGCILDCLRYWVTEMHVDGFRFDLASVLGRDQEGNLLPNPPILESIAEDPILRDVKLVAEAWDAGGAYQVGVFPGLRWSEWNGRFRDDVRCFWRGDKGMVGALASRLCGSADLYQRSGKEPINSINFITCHDGFTLNDLVSYACKHNEANGEDNRDGADENYSSNYGEEGETCIWSIQNIRLRQIKNMLATLLVSRGVPMLLGGDEFRRTQCGNNNAYCQDNEVSWYEWDLLKRNQEVFRFTSKLVDFRKRHKVLSAGKFYTDKDIKWFGPSNKTPDWSGEQSTLGCVIFPEKKEKSNDSPALCMLFNAEIIEIEFELPPAPGNDMWWIAVDTANPVPYDICEQGHEMRLQTQDRYLAESRSMVILISGKS